MLDGYTSSQVRDIVKGVSQRNLDYWAERGVVVPSVSAGGGKGKERRYSFEDIVKIKVVKHLRDVGISLDKIRKAVKKLKARDPQKDPLLEECLIADGKSILHRLKGDQVEDILAGGQLVLNIVRVGLIREETKTATLRLERKLAKLKAGATRRRVKV